MAPRGKRYFLSLEFTPTRFFEPAADSLSVQFTIILVGAFEPSVRGIRPLMYRSSPDACINNDHLVLIFQIATC
jgi:hypothetical protein